MASAYHLAFAAQNLVLAVLALLMLWAFATRERAHVSAAHVITRWRSYRAGVLALTLGVLVSLTLSLLSLPLPQFFFVNLVAYLAYYTGLVLMLHGVGRFRRGVLRWRSS